MASHYPVGRSTRLWGISMTIAAVVLGLYFVALFYFAVITGEEAHLAGQTEQAHMVDQPR